MSGRANRERLAEAHHHRARRGRSCRRCRRPLSAPLRDFCAVLPLDPEASATARAEARSAAARRCRGCGRRQAVAVPWPAEGASAWPAAVARAADRAEAAA